jgi:uncharacterized protein
VRTYVTADGRPGIFFISLDAARSWAVVGARRVYKLPYYRARMSMSKHEWIDFSSERIGAGSKRLRFRARYRPSGHVFRPAQGDIEHFLTERYRLYTSDGSRILCGDAHHGPWSIQSAEAHIEENTMSPEPIELAGEPLFHYSARQDALIWPLRQAEAASNDSASRK